VAELIGPLLRRCEQGDEYAVRELVARFTGSARALAVALLGDEHLAEDAVQDAFCAALARLGQLRSAKAFSSWFRQIVRTEALRIIRRRRDVAAGAMDESATGDSDPGERAELKELRAVVRDAVAKLTPATGRAAELFYLDERSCAQIAHELAVPTGTVKRRLHEARRQLRSMLLGYVAEPAAPGDSGQWSQPL
jgi:RNA polymerase sigma-70 factor (ECF subfamily)